MTIKIDIQTTEDVTIVRPYEDIKSSTIASIREVLRQLIRDGQHHVAIDLQHVNFIDSSGLSLLLHFEKTFKEKNGFIYLYNYSQDVKEILDIIEIGSFVPLYATFEQLQTAMKDR
ncbi:MAG: STAS domain-containing protein [Chitinivibrionales bacterium]|nr:STAS domain-containing protein [Chitinivibrionales bacterium]